MVPVRKQEELTRCEQMVYDVLDIDQKLTVIEIMHLVNNHYSVHWSKTNIKHFCSRLRKKHALRKVPFKQIYFKID